MEPRAGSGLPVQRSAGLQSVWCFCQCVEAVTELEILELLESAGPLVRVPLSSSALASAAYSSGGTLEVEFNDGATYRYSGVPVLVFLGLVNAASPGRY